jgi:endonuclease III
MSDYTANLMNEQRIRKIFNRFRAENPQPGTELIWHTPFELLVSVILSAQATDTSVNKATAKLFQLANTPESMLALGATKLKNTIKTIGLYNTKAKNILATSDRLIKQYHSTVPDSREALESLPGVGRKTANVILNTCFGKPVIAVDTHIFRVAQRIGLAKGSTPLAIEKSLTKIIPEKYLHNAHHWLILHGRYVCTARKPKCPQCLIRDLCEYPDKTNDIASKSKLKIKKPR